LNYIFRIQSEITFREIESICLLKNECWPYGIAKQQKWIHDNIEPEDIHVCGFSNEGKLLAYANLVWRNGFINSDRHTRFSGIGNVCVSGSARGLGLGSLLVRRINKYLEDNNLVGVLLCKDNLIHFYNTNQWHLVANRSKVHVNFNIEKISIMIYNFVGTIENISILGTSF
jgi:predicted GNAT family N-acyltransferase